MQRANIGMLQCGHGTSFALETLAELSLGDLDRNDAIQASVPGLVDFAHPPEPIGARISYGPSLSPG